MATIKEAIGDLNLNKATAVDTENPAVKNFIETVHKAVLQKAQDLQEKDDAQNERTILINRIIKLFCADIEIEPARCAREELKAKYNYDLSGRDIINIWKNEGISRMNNRIEILAAVQNEVDCFISALLSKKPEAYDVFRNAYRKSMAKCQGDSDREKFSRRIFCLMLYTMHPELNIYNDSETLELFKNTKANYIYSAMVEFVRVACGVTDENENATEKNSVFLKDSAAFENPTIKNFIETVHKAVLQKVQDSKEKDDAQNERSILTNRIIKLFCADINLSTAKCARELKEKYNCDLKDSEIIDFWSYNKIRGMDNRIEILAAVKKEVDCFISALLSKKPEDYEALQEAYHNSMIQCRKDSSREKFSRRIFCLMLYTRYPELNIYNDSELFEPFGNTQAKYVYSTMFNCLRIAYGIMDEKQQENEYLKSALQLQENDIKNLNEQFDAQLQAKMRDFFSNLNSVTYGNILDAITKLHNGVKRLREQNVELPLEIIALRPLLNNFRKFLTDNDINPIMRVDSVHSLTAADIDKFSANYEGKPFESATEVKTVRVISPGWRYKDTQISPPTLKEEQAE